MKVFVYIIIWNYKNINDLFIYLYKTDIKKEF